MYSKSVAEVQREPRSPDITASHPTHLMLGVFVLEIAKQWRRFCRTPEVSCLTPGSASRHPSATLQGSATAFSFFNIVAYIQEV